MSNLITPPPANAETVIRTLRRILWWSRMTAIFVVAIFLLLAMTLLTVTP
jgi:LPS O-antigen subunit length determinant protein (WzzB/FepE family)